MESSHSSFDGHEREHTTISFILVSPEDVKGSVR